MKSQPADSQKPPLFMENLRQQSAAGLTGLIISIVATVAAIRALMFINFGVHSPQEALIYRWAVFLSLALPFVSLFFGVVGSRSPEKSNAAGAIGMGVSLFLLTSVGFAYLLSALF